MARRVATVAIDAGGQPTDRTLNELLPPLSSNDAEQFEAEYLAIQTSEQIGWLAINGKINKLL